MLLKNWTLAIVIAFTTLFSSCSKEDAIIAPGTISTNYDSNYVEIELSEEILLKPKFELVDGDAQYRWILNGDVVSNEQVYTFSSEKVNSYKLKFELSNQSGKKIVEYTIRVLGKYSKGLFLVNEGWFGHESGNINFWDRKSNEFSLKVFENENPDKALGITSQFASIQNGNLYVVSKGYASDKGNIIIINPETLKFKASIDIPDSQGRAFVALNKKQGYVSTGGVGTVNGVGIYKVDLVSNTVSSSIPDIGGAEVGNLLISSGKLFALRINTLLVIDVSTDKLIKTISFEGKAGGMLIDNANNLWLAADKELLKINTNSLNVKKITLADGVGVNPCFGWAWNVGSLSYSSVNNSLYFVNGGGWKPKSVARYSIDEDKSYKLFDIEKGYQIYGAGTFIDPVSQKLFVTALKGFGMSALYNRFYVYSLDGKKEKYIDYEGFFFTALCVAN